VKILSGINTPDEFDALCDAGVDELYCGIFQRGEFSHGNSTLNRREGLLFNLAGYEEFKRLVSMANARGVPLYLAVNSFYSQDSLEQAIEQIEGVLPMRPAGFIVADIAVLKYLSEIGFDGEVIISVGGVAFNTSAVRFYHELGATRVTLPRHFTVEELTAFRNMPVELEMILLEDRCQFVDGFCNFYHFYPTKAFLKVISNRFMARRLLPWLFRARVKEGSGVSKASASVIQRAIFGLFSEQRSRFQRPCSIRYEIHPESAGGARLPMDETVQKLTGLLSEHTVYGTCGLCQLPLLEANGIGFLKIANRGKATAQKVKAIELARLAVEAMDELHERDAYVRYVKEGYEKVYGHPCQPSNCYFPGE